jgi:hypothetical protein
MSRKRDPVLTVLAYFSEAELPVAEQGLTLVKAIVTKRRQLGAKPAPRKPAAASKSAAPDAVAADPSTLN